METIGIITTVLAVIGVLANNRRLRWCFLLWFVSNCLSLAIHAYAGIWSLLMRDAIFIILAIEGWIKWGNEVDSDITLEKTSKNSQNKLDSPEKP